MDNIGDAGPGCGLCDWFQDRLGGPPCSPEQGWCSCGADCSGYVSRVWGKRIEDCPPPYECKWGTCGLDDAAVSTLVPYANPDPDLVRRMRMGDIFDDCGNHVVLLYYFDPNSTPANRPIYYEETPPRARKNETGGWGYIAGHDPYRYNEIRDDIYLPWLSYQWYNWETTLFARNNSATAVDYVFQHTIYTGGGDSGAVNNKTYRRTKANDLWELPTGNLQPGSNYRGSGVVAANTGDSALVYVKDNSQAMAYSGIFPFDSLGQASAQTLYMPAFLYTQGGNGLLSKIFVQNAGKVSTSVSATYYGDDGRTCSHTVATLLPWGSTITHPEHCPNWGGTPPAGGSVKLSASQPLAAITLEHVYWNRVGGFNAFSQGSLALYAPELLRNAWGIGWYSTLHLQNVGNKTANVTVSYYPYGV